MPFDPIHYVPPQRPPSPPHRMSKRQESLLIWFVCIWLAAMFVAPIGGAGIIDILAYLLG